MLSGILSDYISLINIIKSGFYLSFKNVSDYVLISEKTGAVNKLTMKHKCNYP